MIYPLCFLFCSEQGVVAPETEPDVCLTEIEEHT
jgi:hypothetical protein